MFPWVRLRARGRIQQDSLGRDVGVGEGIGWDVAIDVLWMESGVLTWVMGTYSSLKILSVGFIEFQFAGWSCVGDILGVGVGLGL